MFQIHQSTGEFETLKVTLKSKYRFFQVGRAFFMKIAFLTSILALDISSWSLNELVNMQHIQSGKWGTIGTAHVSNSLEP